MTELSLDNNDISDLDPLSGLTALAVLELQENNISDLNPLAGLTALTELQLQGNNISDLDPLSGLTALTELQLYVNNISDLSRLLANPGIGDGDLVNVNNNPVDCDAQADNIEALEGRGVQLGVWC